jgi:hypothetical protein
MADYRKRIGRQDSCCRCHRAVVDHGVRKEDEHVLSALLIDELNGMFEADLVETRPGGRGGGNARLSALGRAVVRLCRALENGALGSSSLRMKELTKLMRAEIRKTPPPKRKAG